MSKSVRLPDYLAAEVERLAAEEKRSLANMVKVLLEQALNLERAGAIRIMDGDAPVGIVMPQSTETDAQPRDLPTRTVPQSADDHFKPDFKK